MHSYAIGEPSRGSQILAYAILILAAMVFVAPFVTVLSSSFKPMHEVFEYPPRLVPDQLYFGSYEKLLFHTRFPTWFINTVAVATAVTVIKVATDSMAAYALAKLDITGKRLIFVVMVATLTVPFGAIIVPLYGIAGALGITNSYLGLALVPLANPIGIFLMRQFMVNLPKDLENSARLDGVSEFGLFRRIILPLVKPGMVILSVITVIEVFAMFLWPIVVIRNSQFMTLTPGVSSLRSLGSLDYSVWSAAAVMAIVPMAIFFLLMQRQFIAGSIAGAIKQ